MARITQIGRHLFYRAQARRVQRAGGLSPIPGLAGDPGDAPAGAEAQRAVGRPQMEARTARRRSTSLVEMALLGDERRRHDAGVARPLEQQPGVEQALQGFEAARAGRSGRRQIERRQHPVAANVGDDGKVGQREDPLEEGLREAAARAISSSRA